MIRFPRASLLLAAGLLLGGGLMPAGKSAAQATPEPALSAARTTAIVISATNDPLTVLGSDGQAHLEYDLIVTNAIGSPVTLTSIDVTGPDGQPLLRLEGDALTEATQNLLFMGEQLSEVPGSGTVAVVVDVTVPPDQVPEQVTHRIAYALAPDAPVASLIGSLEIAGPVLDVDPRPSIVLAPPLRGPGWAGLGCCAATSLHRSIRLAVDGETLIKPETFAIDWIRVREGIPFEGDGARNEQWLGYGAEVLAVADGAVVSMRDGMTEETPNQPPVHVKTPEDYGGNHVAIEIAPGVYAFYAHLQPGSVSVAIGDQVTAGQPLGLLGNSGNSTAPHLHFGLIDGADPLTSSSLPMVFARYTTTGSLDPANMGAAPSTPEAATPVSDTVPAPQPQEETLPLDMVISDFG